MSQQAVVQFLTTALECSVYHAPRGSSQKSSYALILRNGPAPIIYGTQNLSGCVWIRIRGRSCAKPKAARASSIFIVPRRSQAPSMQRCPQVSLASLGARLQTGYPRISIDRNGAEERDGLHFRLSCARARNFRGDRESDFRQLCTTAFGVQQRQLR